ncbi:MAG TPA: TonB family protein [Terriglobales bacterium]|nr:TonB family protein [Terriglobales bacterium]
MSTIQIPPPDPATSSNRPTRSPEGDLYDARRWESAYRDLTFSPTLLVQLQDDLSRARMREAFWISLIVHMLLIIAIVNSPKLARFFPKRAVLVVGSDNGIRDKELTFLELPPDAQKAAKRPNSNIISDKDRIATTRKPHLDPNELRKILDAAKAGAPGPGGAPAPKPQPSSPPVQSARSAPPQPATGPNGSPPQTNQTAKLQVPTQPKVNFGASMSAGSAVEQAARAAAANRGGFGGAGGDYGLGQGRQPTDVVGNLDVLSDTMGVDFGPYLARVLHDVRGNWYNLIPEVARAPIMKKGKLTIEFAILKDGRIAGMQLVSGSGDVSLDRGAWGGITASNPFPPLPREFGGQYLALRFHFYYNPDRNELQ